MRITTVFNRLLALQGALVREVAFSSVEVIVTVARRAELHGCPLCSFKTRARYDSRRSSWRHVPLGKWRVVIVADLVRVECPRHGVRTEQVPWAVPDSRFTRDFEDLTAWMAREMNQTAVTRLMHIAWETVGRIVERVVARQPDEGRLDELYRIGIDEVSYRKGHKYLTVVANHDTGEPVWIGEGRSRETLARFFEELGDERTGQLEAVSMDMCAAFIEEVREKAPNAEICFDPFHVVKLASEAVHEVRRGEARERKGTPEADILKGSRWSLLKARENLKPEERVKLAEVARLNAPVYRAYLLKEELRTLYDCDEQQVEGHLDAWLRWARRARLAPFKRLARTVQDHRQGVVAAIRLKLSNGRLEGINNKIAVLKHRAYGFHSAAALIAMVFLCCTDMPITLPI